MGKETLESMLNLFINESLRQMVFSNPVNKDGFLKTKVRPVMIRGQLLFQAEGRKGNQVFHENLSQEKLKEYAKELLKNQFRQAEIFSGLGSGTVLVGKKGTMTVKIQRKIQPGRENGRKTESQAADSAIFLHNRQKHYILQEGRPVPFLVDLGVMTAEGKVVRSRYDKFRQVNRFLEFIEDILPRLDKKKENVILDFGCGKSYLTFAMYYYLHCMKHYPIRIIGLDLKKDVIERCNRLADQYGYEKLSFLPGDIAGYEGVDPVDMVVTLHACDTATDYALAKAVRWGAKVILSVPCCQHELNRQIKNELFEPVLRYGVIRERIAALYTDALRAELLEGEGYRTQILEFIDMEHTPKNLLIRAVKEGKPKDNQKEIQQLLEFLKIQPTLAQLLKSNKTV